MATPEIIQVPKKEDSQILNFAKNAGHGLLTAIATLAPFASGAGLLGAGLALVATNGVLTLRNNRNQPTNVILKDFLQKCMSTVGAISYGGLSVVGISFLPGLETGAISLIAPVVALAVGGPFTKPFADILAIKATDAILSSRRKLETEVSVDKRGENVIRVEVSQEPTLREHKRQGIDQDFKSEKSQDRENNKSR